MMRLSLIPFLLAVEPMLLILRRIEKKLWHMMKQVGRPFKVFVEPGTLQCEIPDSF